MSTVRRVFQLEESLDKEFCRIAQRLDVSPSDALRTFVTAFVANNGFPFALKFPVEKATKRVFDVNHPSIITPAIRNGHAVLPASWREDDENL